MNNTLMKYLDLTKWTHEQQSDYCWQGELDLSLFSRLFVLRDVTANNEQLSVKLQIQQIHSVIWWHLQTQGEFWQTCQRCLNPVAISLNYDNSIALLRDESQLKFINEDDDYILIDELADNQKLWLLPMIEDELLMLLPLSAKHEDCQMAVSTVGAVAEIPEDNPFAVLVNLKQ